MSDAQVSIVSPPHSNRGYLASVTASDTAVFGVGGTHSGMALASANARDFHPRSASNRGLRDVLTVGDRVFVCGQSGTLEYSDDEGGSWTSIEHDGRGCIYRLRAIEGALLASADGGQLLRIDLESLACSKVQTGTDDRLLGVVPTSKGVFLLGGNGELRRAAAPTDAYEVVHEGTAPLTGLVETAVGTLVVTGDRGQLWRSVDGGRTFEAVTHEVHEDLEGLVTVGDRVVAFGGGSTLLVSTDDGVSFESVDVPDAARGKTLWSAVVLEDCVLIGGDDGLVLAYGQVPDAWTSREDRFVPDYPLLGVFADGPEGFIGERLRAFVVAVNGIEEAPDEPAPEPEEEPEEEAEEEEEDDDGEEFQGDDAWKKDAIKRVGHLWSGNTDDFEAIWGVAPPQALVDFEQAVEGANMWTTFNELRLNYALIAEPARDDVNTFEQLILNDQLNYLGTGLPEAFAGLVSVGSLGNGDTYHLGVPGIGEQGSQVIFYDHEEHAFSHEFADSLDSLAYLCAITKVGDDDELPAPALQEGYEALRGRVAPSWHFSMDERDEDFEPYESEDRTHRFYFWRARWLITLFRHDHGGAPESVERSFIPNLNPVVTDEIVEARVGFCERLVPTALYASWRAYVFEEPALDRYLEACRSSASRLIRDSARLIDELRAGRKTLGRIEDWPAVLAGVRALDLDPARAEARAEEEKARKAAAAAKRDEVVAQVGGLEGEALVAFCAEHALEPLTRGALLAAVLERPEHAEANRAATLLTEQDYSRDGKLFRDEQYDACRYLADHATDALQLLLVGEFVAPAEREHAEDNEPPPPGPSLSIGETEQMVLRWCGTDTLLPASRAMIRRALADEELTRHRIASFARLLALAADREAAEPVAQRLRQTPAEGGFETRLNHDDSGRDLSDALGRLGNESHAELLVPLAGSESLMHTPPSAALALARLDPSRGTDEILARLLERTTRVNSHHETARSFVAYGMLGAAQPVERRAGLAQALRACEPLAKSHPDVKAGRALGLEALAPTDDRSEAHAEVLAALHETATYAGYEPHTNQRFVLEALHDQPALGPELQDSLVAMLGTPNDDLRRDTLATLRRLGLDVPPQPTPLQWLTAQQLTIDEALEALADADRPGRHHAIRRLAEDSSARVQQALESTLDRIIERAPEHPGAKLPAGDGPLLREVIVAFQRHDHAPTALYDRTLRHPNRELKGPVLRVAPADPALADAMRIVAAEKYGWQEKTARSWLERHG